MSESMPEVNKSLERATRDSNIEEKPHTESGKTVTCYNSRCPDYKVERPYDVDCSCKRTRIKGAGDQERMYF